MELEGSFHVHKSPPPDLIPSKILVHIITPHLRQTLISFFPIHNNFSQVIPYLQVFQLKLCMYFLFLLCVLHTFAISSSSIWSSLEYLVTRTYYKTPHCVTSQSSCYFPSLVQIFYPVLKKPQPMFFS
jgi:hypothetical protein